MEIKEEVIVKKYIEFNGVKFYPDKRGYWLGHIPGAKSPIRLHRYVWEFYNGPIPAGYDIHHIDHNPDNNEIENLQMVLEGEHAKIHNAEMRQETIDRYRKNLDENARPKAIEWHKSEEGREWHKKHYEEHSRELFSTLVTKNCAVCGKEYTVPYPLASSSRFCSNNCKSQWRRDAGIDDIEVSCAVCGAEFFTNKYAKAKYCSKECRDIGRSRTLAGKPKKRKSKRADDIVSDS